MAFVNEPNLSVPVLARPICDPSNFAEIVELEVKPDPDTFTTEPTTPIGGLTDMVVTANFSKAELPLSSVAVTLWIP